MRKKTRRFIILFIFLLASVWCLSPAVAQQIDRPDILVIFGDDIGIYNISAYHRGMMGGSTPNIDRIANEGLLFTDYYSQQSCTAGRAAFITGQHPFGIENRSGGVGCSKLYFSSNGPKSDGGIR
jgi:arylsulfatase